MVANLGIARRIERANQRIDAAVARLIPDATPPAAARSRGASDMVRAEWLAEALESLVAGADNASDLESMSVDELRDLAAEHDVEGRSGMKKAELVAAIQEAQG